MGSEPVEATNPQIVVSASDNQLVFVAVDKKMDGYTLANFTSGHFKPFKVTMDLAPGKYEGVYSVDGVYKPVDESATRLLPAGAYKLFWVGINWGGPQSFAVNVAGTQHDGPKTPPTPIGVAWKSPIISIQIA